MTTGGYIKTWRRQTEEDLLALGGYEFKMWTLLQLLAYHAPYKDVEPGDVRTTYKELAERLRMDNGRAASPHTIQSCLKKLQDRQYISVLEAKPGRGMTIRIPRWQEMQGTHPAGYEFLREPYPPETEEHPFGPGRVVQ